MHASLIHVSFKLYYTPTGLFCLFVFIGVEYPYLLLECFSMNIALKILVLLEDHHCNILLHFTYVYHIRLIIFRLCIFSLHFII